MVSDTGMQLWAHISGVHLPISPLRRPIALGERHQLQDVECILAALNILLDIFNSASLSSVGGGGVREEGKK